MWILLLIGVVAGAGLTAGFIFTNYVVTTKEAAEESAITNSAIRSRLHVLVAENAKLRVALATGVMAEDAKKIAEATMAALDAVIDTEKVAMQPCNAFTTTQNIDDRIALAISGGETLSRE